MSMLLLSATFMAAQANTLEEMLAAYIEQDNQTKTLALQYQQALLSEETAEHDGGFTLELSTGTVSLEFPKFKAEPSVSIAMPSLNGTTIKASVPIVFSDSSGEHGISGASVSAETEIIGNTRKKTNLSLLKAKRSVLEAERSLHKQLYTAEHEFYEKLKSIC